MDHNSARTDHSPKDAEKAGGCCGGHKAGDDADARPEPQAEAKKPVAKSGGCCCG